MKKNWTVLFVLLAALLFSTASLADAGVNYQAIAEDYVPSTAVYLKLETDDGVYDYTFWDEAAQTSYEVIVDPATEKVLKVDSDIADAGGSRTVAITEADARAKLLAEYPAANVDFAVLDLDDGRYTYKVVFTTSEFSGVYKVNPETGAVMEREFDYVLPATSANVSGSSVTAEQAKTMILSRVPNGTFADFSYDRDDGRTVYEGEIVSGDTVYDFELDAATGRFLEWEAETLRTAAEATSAPSAPSAPDTSTGLIGTARAKEIALAKAGGGRVTSIRLERDDGRQVYDGTVITDSYEYEFEIDAVTGSVRDWDRDRITTTANTNNTSNNKYQDTPDNTPDYDNTPNYNNTPDNTPDNSRDYDDSRD